MHKNSVGLIGYCVSTNCIDWQSHQSSLLTVDGVYKLLNNDMVLCLRGDIYPYVNNRSFSRIWSVAT